MIYIFPYDLNSTNLNYHVRSKVKDTLKGSDSFLILIKSK